MDKIGVLGGTFDPIHNGHLQLAKTAFMQYELDKVLILPDANQWMKKDRDITSADKRVDMIKKAIADIPYFELDMTEIEMGGISYTYKTLHALKAKYPNDELYFIIGADSLLNFMNWMNPDIILKNATLLVAIRDDTSIMTLNKKIYEITKTYGGKILCLKMAKMDVSSTVIRRDFYKSSAISRMLPYGVYEYIRDNHLYDKEYEKKQLVDAIKEIDEQAKEQAEASKKKNQI